MTAPTVIIAIHGVGNPISGEIEQCVADSLTAGNIQNVDVREFNWNSSHLYPLESNRLKWKSAEELARGFLRAAGIGFANARSEYAGFGVGGIAVHNFLASVGRFLMALTFALIVVLPSLTGMVLIPVYWLWPSSYAVVFHLIYWILTWTLIASMAVLGLLLLLGASYAVIGAGDRRSHPAILPLAVTARRVLLILLRPAILIALPPFTFPLWSTAGKWVAVFKYANLAAFIVYPIIWVAWGAVGVPNYVFATNLTVVIFVLLCWLAAWTTKTLVAPSLKIFLDIFRYVSDPEHRNWLQRQLDAVIQEERAKGRYSFAILAHSLGSVIAVDSLVNSGAWQPADRVLLVTMGSPLRRLFFRFLPNLYFPSSADGIGDMAAARLGDFRWVNVYRPWDQVGTSLGLTRSGSVERSSGQWGRILTAHPNYWSDSTVRVQAEQAIRGVQNVRKPDWQPNAGRLAGKIMMPRPGAREDPVAINCYRVLAGLLFVATPILFAGTLGASKEQWNLILAEKKEELLRRGVISDATVVYRVTAKYWYNSTTKQTETDYYDQFEFRFTPNGVAQVINKVEVPEIGWSDHERFFDVTTLVRAIKTRGQVLGKTSLFWPADYIGRQLQHVKLVYNPDELTDPDAMWVLLPEYPPQRSPLVPSVIEWIFRTLLAVGGGVVGGLPIVWGSYACFVYFLGPPTAKDRSEEEIAAYDDQIARFGTATELPLREQLAVALVNKVFALGALERSADAIVAYNDLVARFGTASDLPPRKQVAQALVHKGFALGALEHNVEEIAVYDDLIAHFGAAHELRLRELVAEALVRKGLALGAQERSADAIDVYDDLIARIGTATELSLRELVAKALWNKGGALGALGRSTEEIAVYDDLLSRCGTATELSLRELVAKALVNKGVTLGALRRSVDAIVVYDDLIARFGSAFELPLREQLAMALVHKGCALGALERNADAIAVYDDVIARFGTATGLPLREQVGIALFNKGLTLGTLERSADAVAVYNDLIDRYRAAPERPLREQVAKALVSKGLALGALERSAEEIAVYDDLIARFGIATELPLRELVAKALVSKGLALVLVPVEIRSYLLMSGCRSAREGSDPAAVRAAAAGRIQPVARWRDQ